MGLAVAEYYKYVPGERNHGRGARAANSSCGRCRILPWSTHFKGPEADVRMAESCVKTAFCAQETDEPTSLSSKESCTIDSVGRFEGRVRSREALHIPRAQTKVRMRYELRV